MESLEQCYINLHHGFRVCTFLTDTAGTGVHSMTDTNGDHDRFSTLWKCESWIFLVTVG